ncbi:MAG: flagellar hook-basal body complex protein FliE [Opitutaceae bacterium]
MNPVGSINPLAASGLTRLDAPLPPGGLTMPGATSGIPEGGFGKVLDGLVAVVDGKQANAQAVTRQVLLGDSGQLHQSVIAMQEASVAFSMMVEVRNKLVESYQELMRMQV